MLDYAKELGSGSNLEQPREKPSLWICGTCFDAYIVALLAQQHHEHVDVAGRAADPY
jgi:hypothetical protein